MSDALQTQTTRLVSGPPLRAATKQPPSAFRRLDGVGADAARASVTNQNSAAVDAPTFTHDVSPKLNARPQYTPFLERGLRVAKQATGED